MKNYIYLDKGYHKDLSEKLFNEIKKNSGIIINLDEEGGVDYANKNALKARYTKSLFEHVDFTFFWGSVQYELAKDKIITDSKTMITGHPRFELLKPQYRYLFNDSVKKINRKFGDFILINTNMSFGNNIRGDDFVISNYGHRFKEIKQIIAFDKKKLKAYRSMILDVSLKTKKTIVIRPHPEEDHSFYHELINNNKNIHLINEGSVISWILASNIMIHPDCTTAIESLFIGRKPISFLPINFNEELVANLPLKGSLIFNNKDKLIDFINSDSINNENDDVFKYKFLEESFSISKDTINIIVEQISRIAKNINNQNLYYLKLSNRIHFLLKNIQSVIMPDDKLIKSKVADFSRKRVEKYHKNIISNELHFKNILYKKITNKLFYFFKGKQF